ncbi:Ig-like domain-containing protein [Kamptonema cortianum]|nr:Ig-like domain-containing protein [Kamptonema cortianum]
MTANVKDGDSISGNFVIDVRVQSDHLVTSVEFYVGANLRDTDSSTPYQFRIDTLEEPDGPFKITLAAYNAEGESVKKEFNLKIDNGMSKGVDFHVDRANTLISESKFDEAVTACRIALKIDSKNNRARITMARANYLKGFFDIAQKFAEDVATDDPSNKEAKTLLSSINLRRAFLAGGANAAETASLIRGSLKTAVKAAAEARDAEADAFGSRTEANTVAWADAMLKSHRYGTVVNALRQKFNQAPETFSKDTQLVNRYLYALVRSGRLTEAGKLLIQVDRTGAPDGYTYALKAAVAQFAGEDALSESAEKDAILEDPTSLAIKYTQAYLAVVRGKYDVMATFVNELNRLDPQSSLTAYYRSVRTYLSRDYDMSRRDFETALLADPGNYDMLVEKGNQVIESAASLNLQGDDLSARLDIALAYFEAALESRAESFEALTGISLVHAMAGRLTEANNYGRAAIAAGEEYAPAYFALAAILNMQMVRQTGSEAAATRTLAEQVRQRYESLDKRLKGRIAPTALQAWGNFYRTGRVPALPTPVMAE